MILRAIGSGLVRVRVDAVDAVPYGSGSRTDGEDRGTEPPAMRRGGSVTSTPPTPPAPAPSAIVELARKLEADPDARAVLAEALAGEVPRPPART